ncbi:MAG: hypothetical protein ACPGVG_06340, partial [Mycobacterium sp.]
MQWNAWGDPAAAKPLSPSIRTLLSQALGIDGQGPEQPSADQVQLRPSTLSQADREGLSSLNLSHAVAVALHEASRTHSTTDRP